MNSKPEKSNRSLTYFILALGIFNLIATLVIYQSLPAEVASHWNISGEVDRYSGRWIVLLTGSLPLIIYGLMLIIQRIDPRRDSYRRHKHVFELVILAITLFLITIHWLTIAFSLGVAVNVIFYVKLILALLFLVLGNYTPQIRHNYTFGIRTPWTLANEEVWHQTHRIGGRVFAGVGIIALAATFISHSIAFYLVIGSIIVAAIGLIVYSYFIFRSLE